MNARGACQINKWKARQLSSSRTIRWRSICRFKYSILKQKLDPKCIGCWVKKRKADKEKRWNVLQGQKVYWKHAPHGNGEMLDRPYVKGSWEVVGKHCCTYKTQHWMRCLHINLTSSFFPHTSTWADGGIWSSRRSLIKRFLLKVTDRPRRLLSCTYSAVWKKCWI